MKGQKGWQMKVGLVCGRWRPATFDEERNKAFSQIANLAGVKMNSVCPCPACLVYLIYQ